jgi:predicted AlkP superfamily phosphohydrolase/phosphomutase
MKTVLFGLDGATYTVLNPLMQKGVMPNMKRLVERGTRCELMSTPLPITPQAWTSMATSRGAGEHGIHDFIRVDRQPDGSLFFRVNNSNDNHCETIWQYASRSGRRVTVLNYFGVAPPKPVNGHLIPGFTSGRHLRRSSYPDDLFQRLQGVEGLDINTLGLDLAIEKQGLQDMETEKWCEWIDHHIKREKILFGVMKHLMTHEPADLTMIVFDGVDKNQHLAYRLLDPAYAPRNPTPAEAKATEQLHAYFRQVDDFLGQTIQMVGAWGRVFVASDHGFTATTQLFYINKWLEENGYLCWRDEVDEDTKASIFVERLRDLTDAIHPDKTKAFALTPSCNGIFICAKPHEYDRVREDIIRGLLKIKGIDGRPLVTEIKKREEWFAGPYMDRIPDLTLTLSDYGLFSVLNSKDIVIKRKETAGTHHPHGILMGIGPGIRQGAEVPLKNILDVTPLLAHSLGMDIPGDYKGTFPNDFYEADYLKSDPAKISGSVNPVTANTTPAVSDGNGEMDSTDEKILMDRLRSLGYIE